MVEFLNQKNSGFDFSIQEFDIKLPPMKKKVYKKIPVPHYPNVDVPMTEKEILEFKKKYPQRVIDYKKQRPEGSEQIELKNLFGSTSPLENTEIYDNAPDVVNDNSIVGDPYLDEYRTNNYIKGYFYHKLGNCYSFLADKKGNPMIIIGRKWYIYAGLSTILQFLMWFYLFFYKDELEQGVRITGMIIIILFQIIYTIAYISNPGFPRNNVGRMKGTPTEQYKYCSECLFYINKCRKVFHCFECGICVEGFHRHSFLINKCVGRKNFVLFVLFIISLIIIIIYIVTVIGLAYS